MNGIEQVRTRKCRRPTHWAQWAAPWTETVMPDCYCKREYLDPSVRRMRSNDGIVHGVNGCFSSGETGVGGRSWEKRALDAEEKVQRVRDVPKKVAVARRGDVDNPQKLAWYQGWNEAIDAVFRALDGGAE